MTIFFKNYVSDPHPRFFESDLDPQNYLGPSGSVSAALQRYCTVFVYCVGVGVHVQQLHQNSVAGAPQVRVAGQPSHAEMKRLKM